MCTSRRNFLGTCAALGTTTLFSSIFNLGMANSLANFGLNNKSPNNNYKALVCILLAGGNDSFNMLVPRNGNNYTEYANSRSNLALAQGDLLSLNYTDPNGKQFGVHPSMPEIQQLFNNNKLAFVSNVGTLVEPTTKAQFLNNSVTLPVGLLSHADQIQQWQTSIPQTRSARGWGGKMADILSASNANQNISMNISLSGTNIFQAGNSTVEYAITNKNNGSVGINVYEDANTVDQILHSGVNSLLNQQYQDIYKKTYVDKIKYSQDSHEEFSAAIAAGTPIATQFSANTVSQNMKMIARTIASRDVLNVQRQTFFVLFGGWDHHDEVLNNQINMLGVVSKAMGEFQTAVEELNVADSVTTFTASDFGRTLTSNGNGTDHAWGGNVMVMGDSVNGGNIYGNYPTLALNSSMDVGDGVLVPTTSTDEYFAELALWFGVSPSDLTDILPNIGNFYSPTSGSNPLGFMI